MRDREYHIYRLNEFGVVDTAKSLGFPDDESAKAHARALFHPGKIEVWRGGNRICVVPPAIERRGMQRRIGDAAAA
ncbi:MAG: hypothetical protein JO290_08440 [Sphingomonadaceae bacterium]|nr:hypothetical protein [Sphingomonadaceae bacterium]